MSDASLFDRSDYIVVPKGWGEEIWITNHSLYCGKLLNLFSGKKLSWHYHKEKDEVIFVQSGRVVFRHGSDDDISSASEVLLGVGQSVRVYPGIRHQIEALEDSQLIEFSTQHFEEDSVRVIRGD